MKRILLPRVLLLFALMILSGGLAQTGAQTIKILAVMAEFQPDADATTVGKGLFDSLYTVDWGKNILDPLPHDSSYFANHLLFAKNYFRKVSNGLVQIEYTVLPKPVRLQKTMKNYSPAVNSTDFKPIGDLMSETWRMIDSAYPNIDFSAFNMFAVFHAGVGRDVSLPGSLGNERDIPSVYINLKSLQKMFGATYQGVPVRGGTFHISNSMILPQSENREGESFGKKYLTQLTFNGLLVSNIASHLNLPDLFNTKTGISAIGRFGLMDGQAIFAYNGIIPPEPSAWEKIYLGWQNPVTLTASSYPSVALTAHTASKPGDTTIVKIPINANEYFLVENRQRDTKKDGAIVTFVSDGTVHTKSFPKDTTGFYSYRTDSLYGVITDIDEFDWAVPGNGLAIWHIDEKTIREALPDNAINNNKSRRGVELEEADGIKDIGNQFTTILGDVVTGEGTDEDLWYSGNPAVLYRNKFDDGTRPSTSSYDGSKSLITMSNFSPNSNTMTFRLSYGNENIVQKFTKTLNISPTVKAVFAESFLDAPAIFIYAGDSLFVYDTVGTQLRIIPDFSDYLPKFGGDMIVGVKDSVLTVFRNNQLYSHNCGGKIQAAPAVHAGSELTMIIATAAAKMEKVTFNFSNSSFTQAALQSIPAGASAVKISGLPTNYIAGFNTGGSGLLISADGASISIPSRITDFYNYFSGTDWTTAILLNDNRVAIVNSGGLQKIIQTTLPSVKHFALADINKDGNPSIVVSDSTQIAVYNLAGFPAAGFPLSLQSGAGSLHAAFDNLAQQPILYSVTPTNISALRGSDAKQLSGYPAALSSLPSAFSVGVLNGKPVLLTLSYGKELSLLQLSERSHTLLFGSSVHLRSNGNVSLAVGSATGSVFLPKDKVYNYPNPVYGKSTFIRYFVPENASVTIKIFDLSGDLAASLTQSARGGFENECEWDVSGIQSGVYLAHVEALGSSGKKETAVIKIAVVK